MRHVLKLHPDSCCDAVTGIEVEVLRPAPGRLALRYEVTGSVDDLVLPPVTAPRRRDGLWRRTCFEAFVSAGDGYCEFNLAPSTAWAAYRFDGYRQGMSPADVEAPRIAMSPTGTGFELHAMLDLGGDTPPPAHAPWRLGLSAVIEEAGDRISYWALGHPPGRPDFHHADCFALELPATQLP